MKHAYLIIAHNEFEILKLLIHALDDKRNDIYIHFDKKTKEIPILHTKESNLYILSERIDVRWGDYSQIKTELALFKKAYDKGPYLYYHLLSGVDLPLKSQDAIHSFFNTHQGKEFIGFHARDISKEVVKRAKVYHLFSKNFRERRSLKSYLQRALRSVVVNAQCLLGIYRNNNLDLKQGHNWVSITNDFVQELIGKRKWIEKSFHHSFCCDEVYKHTICWNSPFRNSLFDVANEYRGCMRLFNWQGSQIFSFDEKDIGMLLKSDLLFGRKFSEDKIAVAHKIVESYG